MIRDLRHALRSLVRNPGFTLVAVVTLALGIGANTAIFSVVYGVVLKPLPYPQPEKVVSLAETNLARGYAAASLSPANFLDYARVSKDLATFALYNTYTLALSGAGEARRVDVVSATPELFPVLGFPVLAGRTFVPEEAVAGAPRVAVLTHRLFAGTFGGDAAIVGRDIVLDGVPFRVVGVLPKDFVFPLSGSDVIVPFKFPKDVESQRGAHYLSSIGRLKGNATAAAVDRRVADEAKRLERDHPEKNKGWGGSVVPLQERIVRGVKPALLVLLGAVALVALVACANVANLLLARAAAREGAIAIEVALGAGRTRLMRRLLAESALLALAGGAAAVLLAVWTVDALVRLGPSDIPRLAAVRLDGAVLAFTAALSAATCFLCGLIPALRATRSGLVERMKSRERIGVSPNEGRLRGTLVASEIALTLTLLIGAGLLLKSFRTLVSVDPGLRTANVLTFELSVSDTRYPDGAAMSGFYDGLLRRIEALPGVVSAGGINGLPLTDFGFSSSFKVEGAPVKEEDEPSASLRIVNGRYFETLGVPILAGRGFTADDRRGGPKAILASERARSLFADRNPIGKRLRFGASPGPDRIEGEVVGIVADVKDEGLDAASSPLFYASLAQAATTDMSIVVKTSVPPLAVAEAIRREVRALDPALPVYGMQALDTVVARSVSRPRFYALLLAGFASIALVLAAVGLYGVIAYGVARRTREIGVRVALGARPADVLTMVLSEGTRLLGIGLGAGLLLALAATRLLKSLLFGVSPTDPASVAIVAALLSAVALLACAVPSLRAARLDPVEALRSE